MFARNLWFFLFCTAWTVAQQQVVYVVPNDDEHFNNRLFALANEQDKTCIWSAAWKPNMWLAVKKKLEARSSYILKTPTKRDNMHQELEQAAWVIDMTDNLVFSLPLSNKKLLAKTITMLWEPPVVTDWTWDKEYHNRVAKVLTWDDSIVDHKKYFPFRWPVYSGFQLRYVRPFHKKKLCCFINANKGSKHSQELYSERLKSVHYFEQRHPYSFDFFGVGWDRRRFKTYKGRIPQDDKIPYLRRYRFCLCYENMRDVHGYLTEKIFNCFEAGCVPIYWGISNINKFVPENCYIDRTKFANHRQLYKYIAQMKEEEYETYITNIKNYLQSTAPKEFAIERFADYVVDCILA